MVLVVLAVLACLWLVQDARRTGRRAAPWILLTLTAGSLGALRDLVARTHTLVTYAPSAVRMGR